MGDKEQKRNLTAARHLVGGLYHYQSRYGGDVYLSNWHVNDVAFAARTLADAHAAGRAERDAEVRALRRVAEVALKVAGLRLIGTLDATLEIEFDKALAQLPTEAGNG